MTGGQFGINVDGKSNVIENNTVTAAGTILFMNGALSGGIYVNGGGSNNITGNCLDNNLNGMGFYSTSHNLIVGNNISGGSNPYNAWSGGIYFIDASNNTIYHNNFVNNLGGQVEVTSSINTWDDGYLGGGNYWSDYQTRYPKAAEIDNLGIGNTPYVIDSQNKDQYPLMEPFTTSFQQNYTQEVTPQQISIISPVNQTYNETSVPLVFTVDKTVDWAGYSLDGQQNVTVTGNCALKSGAMANFTIANMTNGLHSIQIYANDTFGVIGKSETINFTIAYAPLMKPEPFPTVPVAAVSGASAAVVAVGAGLAVYFKKRRVEK